MKPQEKAKEIVEKYLLEVRGADRYNYNLESMNLFIAKKCAIICVKELIDHCGLVEPYLGKDYWDEVLVEIDFVITMQMYK